MSYVEPVVSVLVTVYNREQYLRATLESILASSYSDLEVLVIDDCSQDHSLAVAHEVASKDERIKVVANEENLGDYGNRMKAASLARGRYLKYVDSDDLIYPHTLEVMVAALEQHEDASLAIAHALADDLEPFPWRLTPVEASRKHFLGRGCFGCGPTGAIIRRSAFESVGGFRKEWRVLSDIDLWIRLSVGAPIVLLPPGLVWWRRHEGQEYRSQNAMLDYLENGHRLGTEALQSADCPLSPVERAEAIRRLNQHHARRLISLAVRGFQPITAVRLFRRSGLSFLDLAKGLRRYST